MLALKSELYWKKKLVARQNLKCGAIHMGTIGNPHNVCLWFIIILYYRWSTLYSHIFMGWAVPSLSKMLADCNSYQDTAYWICCFSINQHAGICGYVPPDLQDPVTHALPKACSCKHPKHWSDSEPLKDGQSVDCEMNKFDNMMDAWSFWFALQVWKPFNLFFYMLVLGKPWLVSYPREFPLGFFRAVWVVWSCFSFNKAFQVFTACTWASLRTAFFPWTLSAANWSLLTYSSISLLEPGALPGFIKLNRCTCHNVGSPKLAWPRCC